MTFLLFVLALLPASADAQCYSPSDCVPPMHCTSLDDGIVPGTCVGAKLNVQLHTDEPKKEIPPPAKIVPVEKPARPRLSSSSRSSSKAAVVSRIDIPTPAERFWGFNEPIIDPGAIATPLTISTDPAVVSSNLLLALLTAAIFLLLSGPLAAALLIAPQNVKSLLNRLPLSIAVFIVLFLVARFFLPVASAQGVVASLPNPSVLLPIYGIAFFLVAGVTNFVCNNMLTAEAQHLERFVLPAKAATGAWKRTTIAVTIATLLFAVVGAHIASGFSLLPFAQPGAALLALLAVVIAVYSKDGLRYLIAKYRRWDPVFEANVLGIVLAVLSVLLTRSLELSPGYIFGVPIGLVIGVNLDREREGWFELSGLGAMLVCAFVAWLFLAVVPSHTTGQNFLTFLVVILIEGAFFESLPHRYLAGGPVYRWKKWVWGLLCAITTFLALHVLWNTSSTVTSLEQSPPALTYVYILVGYVVAVLALIVYCHRKRQSALSS